MHFFLKVSHVHRYWNDPIVLTKLGKEIGFGIPSDTPTSSKRTGADEGEEDNGDENDDELTIHNTISIHDVHVSLLFKDRLLHLCCKMLFILNK